MDERAHNQKYQFLRVLCGDISRWHVVGYVYCAVLMSFQLFQPNDDRLFAVFSSADK